MERDYYKPTIHKVGYIGEGKFKFSVKKVLTREYNVWCSMIKRCYSKTYQDKHKSYVGVLVCKEWHNFQVFGKWFEENYIEGWSLDKDILCYECREYSPKTCCFIPKEINSTFIRGNKGDYSRGVEKINSKYKATLFCYNKSIYLGVFETLEEAIRVEQNAKKEYTIDLANKWKDLIREDVYNAMINFF